MLSGTAKWAVRELYSIAPDSKRWVQLGDYFVPERVIAMRYGNPEDAASGTRAPSVVFTFEVRDGGAVCVDVKASAGETGERPIRQSDLALNLDALAESAFLHAATHVDDDPSVPAVTFRQGKPPLYASDPAKPGAKREVHDVIERGHQGIGELRQVALIYLDPRHRKRRSQAVIELLGYPRTTAFRKIGQARESGLIPAKGATPADMDAAWVALSEGADDGEEQ